MLDAVFVILIVTAVGVTIAMAGFFDRLREV